jgi:hypothetical protein
MEFSFRQRIKIVIAQKSPQLADKVIPIICLSSNDDIDPHRKYENCRLESNFFSRASTILTYDNIATMIIEWQRRGKLRASFVA